MTSLALPAAALRRAVAGAALAFLIGVSPAHAQLTGLPIIPMGSPGGSPVQGMDTGYDPVNNVYLVVSAYLSAYGWFVNTSGTIVAGPFFIRSNAFAPSVTYSPHVNSGQGGFLVTYVAEGAKQANTLLGRIITYPGTLGSEAALSDSSSYSWLTAGSNAVAYSSASQKFLVAWMTNVGAMNLRVRVVGLDGSPVGSPTAVSSYVGLFPGVAWNPSTDRFGVSFIDEGSVGYAAVAIVTPFGSMEARERFNAVAGQQGATDIDFNPDTGRFVMSWFQQPGSWELRSAEVGTSANVIASGLVYSKAGDIGFSSLSTAFNPVSRTFLGSTLETVGTLDPVMGFELNRNGVRTSSVTQVGPGVLARNIRVSANTEAASWNIAFNHNTSRAVNLVVTTTSTGGGPAGVHGSAPPPSSPTPTPTPTPAPTSCTTPQPASNWTCVNGNWLPPTTGSTGGTSACPTTQPASDWVCVNGNWLPPSSGGSTGGTSACPTTQPGSNWVCVNGNWLPPSSGGSTGGSTSSCPTVRPASDWVCVSGNWLPPNLAPAGSGGSTGGSTSGCTTPRPSAGTWVCVNGGWIPGSGGGSTGGSTGSCTTVRPASDWVCVNGNWLPPAMAPAGSGGSTGGSTSSCTTPRPTAGTWVCVSGNWIPSTSGTAGGCTGSDPFAGIPGLSGICVNGDWKPVLSGG